MYDILIDSWSPNNNLIYWKAYKRSDCVGICINFASNNDLKMYFIQ